MVWSKEKKVWPKEYVWPKEVVALLDKKDSGTDYFRIEKLNERYENKPTYDIRSPRHAFLKDFVTNTYYNAENEASFNKIREDGKIAGSLTDYGVWRIAVAEEAIKKAEAGIESSKA